MATDNIIPEHLRAMRADLAELKEGQREIVRHIISLRSREHAQDGDLVTHTRQSHGSRPRWTDKAPA